MGKNILGLFFVAFLFLAAGPAGAQSANISFDDGIDVRTITAKLHEDARQMPGVKIAAVTNSIPVLYPTLPILGLAQTQSNGIIELKVTFAIQPCKYKFKSIELEPLPYQVLGITRVGVKVLASERIRGECMGPIVQRVETMSFRTGIAGAYEFVPIQP